MPYEHDLPAERGSWGARVDGDDGVEIHPPKTAVGGKGYLVSLQALLQQVPGVIVHGIPTVERTVLKGQDEKMKKYRTKMRETKNAKKNPKKKEEKSVPDKWLGGLHGVSCDVYIIHVTACPCSKCSERGPMCILLLVGGTICKQHSSF